MVPDWNNNGKKDAFDSFMDIKIMADSNNDVRKATKTNTINTKKIKAYDDETTISSNNNIYVSDSEFANELKKNMRTNSQVKTEEINREWNSALTSAKLDLYKIKDGLLNSSKYARYTTQNGVTTFYYLHRLPIQYMRRQSHNNGDQLRQNQQTFVLFRDPNLIYRTWDTFDINPKYQKEYQLHIKALKQIAKEENIEIEVVLHDAKEDKVYPFPTKKDRNYGISDYLCVRAITSIISNQTEYQNYLKKKAIDETKAVIQEVQKNNQTKNYEQNHESKKSSSTSGISMNGKVIYDASKDSDWVVAFKGFGAAGICFFGIFFPIASGMEGLAIPIFIFVSVALALALLKNT